VSSRATWAARWSCCREQPSRPAKSCRWCERRGRDAAECQRPDLPPAGSASSRWPPSPRRQSPHPLLLPPQATAGSPSTRSTRKCLCLEHPPPGGSFSKEQLQPPSTLKTNLATSQPTAASVLWIFNTRLVYKFVSLLCCPWSVFWLYVIRLGRKRQPYF
jgi:hypothetical protein